MVSGKIINKEIPGNHGRKTIVPQSAELYIVSDLPEQCRVTLGWTLYCKDKICGNGSKRIVITPNKAPCIQKVDLKPFTNLNRNDLVLRIWLEKNEDVISENTLLFVEPRFMTFNNEKPLIKVCTVKNNQCKIILKSPSFAYQVALDFGKYQFRSSDNFFNLFPGISKTIDVQFPASINPQAALKAMTAMSYVDSF
jgi:beta-mannosidase